MCVVMELDDKRIKSHVCPDVLKPSTIYIGRYICLQLELLLAKDCCGVFTVTICITCADAGYAS